LSPRKKLHFGAPGGDSFIEYGPLPTLAQIMAYRCDCGTERVLVDDCTKPLTPDDWDKIINAI
jgi:hypothetical protein